MGGATRFMTLLITPFPPIRPSLILLHCRFSALSITPLRLHTLSSPYKTKIPTPKPVNSFHSQTNNNTYTLHSSAAQQQQHHPWPEWTNFLNFLSNGQGFSAPEDQRIPPEDAFVVYEELTDDFVSAAAACMAFARARPDLLGLLSRRDIEAVVSNGTPFLLKSALDTARRMRAFLGTDGGNVSQFDKANTIDLMKYIISYASNPTISSDQRNGLYSRELVDSSVRNLLHELGTKCGGVPTGYAPASGHQFSGRDGHIPKPFGQNVEMKRGDWICQKCNFMNFARNMTCLECEEPRPRKQLTGREWECPQCNFFNYGRNLVCLRCDCRRPGAPLFTNNNSQNVGAKFSPPISQSGPSDFQYQGSHNSNRVPFVPLPADAFSRKDQNSEMDEGKHVQVEVSSTASSGVGNQATISGKSQDLVEIFQFPKDSASQAETQSKENEQTEKSERWFKRMAELHNVKDLPSAVSDEDFPEIMPMRKGENRFVVSKRKDRSLSSPQYKRQVAMDQANNTNFVPFVPFSPDYFAKRDTEQSINADSLEKTVSDTSFSKMMADEKLADTTTSTVPRDDQNAMSSINSELPRETTSDTSKVARTHNQPISSSSQVTSPSGSTVDSINRNTWNNGYSRTGNGSLAETGSTSSQLQKNENVGSGWTGKSLEGSAVKELDRLDMSEEAKAERWFKRVAQIKDISELSQIPDEDFPSIMPMRKGVNRFVVSKRKTPLERRLTSQQYRRNLPIVTNDSVKKESDNS